jgi:hypothetical protein
MEDEEDFTSPLDFASLSGMARQADAQVQAQITNYRNMLAAGTKRMREQRIGPSSTERLLALAQALGSPTTTGKFGERMGLIAGTLGGQQRAQREAEIERADTLEKLGLKGAEFELGAAQTRANTLATMVQRQEAARAAAAAANRPGERERMIARALTLPEDSPERKLILASITGTPENIAAAGARAAAIQATKPPPSSKGGKSEPKYKRGPDGKLYRWSPE